MIIATFGPSTGWVGKRIVYEGQRFVLEGHGEITAQGVLEYDRQGHISWAYAGLREWVQQVATGAAATAPDARPLTVTQAAQSSRGFPAWAIALIVIAALVVLAVVIAIPMKAGQDEKAREAAVKEGIYSLQIGVQSWAVDNNDTYPSPSLVNESDLATWVTYWPSNPYTGLPMAQGTGPGDFAYTVNPDGSFSLLGYGKGGNAVITVP